MKLALKITPQRSTQYTNMTVALAIPELLSSPLHTIISDVTLTTLGGQRYVLVTIDDNQPSSSALNDILDRMGATSEVYEYFEQIGPVTGPLLRPLSPRFTPFVPLEMTEARRYRGKTNEIFTRVLLNVALFAGAYSGKMGERLRILDPLVGGGTTLFLALAYGYDAFGIELERQDVETTAVFIKQYLTGEHTPYKERDERARRAGRRYVFEVGKKGETRTLVLVHGDAAEADLHMREVPGGPHMHAVVADLPYGIQHFGEIADLLTRSLPAWERLLLPGGTIALAWNATRIERAAMVELIEHCTNLHVCNEPPFTEFIHTVDRVIKKRDLVVAVAKEDRLIRGEKERV
jgi:SAM-dependent methyltransferase